jgi:hypothetical protein
MIPPMPVRSRDFTNVTGSLRARWLASPPWLHLVACEVEEAIVPRDVVQPTASHYDDLWREPDRSGSSAPQIEHVQGLSLHTRLSIATRKRLADGPPRLRQACMRLILQ